MTKSLRSMALGAALVAGLASVAAAQTAQDSGRARERSARVDGRDRDRGGRFGRALFRGVNLTDQQKAQIKTIREKYRPQYQALRKPATAGAQRHRPDSATMAQIRSLMERERGEVRGVLTAEQQTVFDQNVARMQERGRERRTRRG